MTRETNKNAAAKRLGLIRQALAKRDLAAWIAPSCDPHSSEYLPEHWAFRRWASGFTGSAGTLVVTADKAWLWTDSRYWDQAARELAGSGIELMKDGEAATPEITQLLIEELNGKNATVGIDQSCISSARVTAMAESFAGTDLALSDSADFVDAVWKDRDPMPQGRIFAFTRAQAPRSEKLAAVRKAVAEHRADALVITTLDDIAWLTNLRGADIECTPVFVSYMTVTADKAVLWTDSAKFETDSITEDLALDGIEVRPYPENFAEIAKTLRGTTALIDLSTVSARLEDALSNDAEIKIATGRQPVTLLKCIKNSNEIQAIRETMETDGVALCELFAWLDNELVFDRFPTEIEVSEKLLEFRKKSPDFIEMSFGTIAAFGANAAEPHYAPKPESSSTLARGNVLLIDSGGQYTGGTTDVTRTVAIGDVPAQLKRDYTAVLRGHIALASVRFPAGTYASQLDTVARAPVWEIEADYGHGTGHGVGYCLSVHEGPVHISPRAPAVATSRLFPGLVLSNEPGLYRTGQWGIRTENLVTVVESETSATATSAFLEFETLTLCPIDMRLIDVAMLSPTDLLWINMYHRRVRNTLYDRLSPLAQKWIEKMTEVV